MVADAFLNILKSSNRKPNKIWVNQGGELYNSSLKKWLEDNDIKTYSTCNERKSAVAEKFVQSLKSEIYKHVTVPS